MTVEPDDAIDSITQTDITTQADNANRASAASKTEAQAQAKSEAAALKELTVVGGHKGCSVGDRCSDDESVKGIPSPVQIQRLSDGFTNPPEAPQRTGASDRQSTAQSGYRRVNSHH